MTAEQTDRVYELAGKNRHLLASALNNASEVLDICQKAKGLNGSRPQVPPLLAVLLVGLVCLGVGAGYSREVPPMSEVKGLYPSTELEMARAALKDGHHYEALKYFRKIRDANPEVLFGMAQCQFRANQYDEAMQTCELLDVATGGTSWQAPLVRGWIAQRRGHKISAAICYKQSAKYGNPDALELVKGVE